MGSYYIPSNKLKGESRILYIFTAKSLIYTAASALIGLFLYLIFSLVGLKAVGVGCIVILAIIGFCIGTVKMPTNRETKISKNVGGDSLDEIIMRYIRFKQNKKIYTVAIPRKEPDYSTPGNPLEILGFKNENNTKEDKK